MIRFRQLLTATVVAFVVSSSAFADVTWDAVKKKITSAKAYETSYRYDGPKGKFKFDYRCMPPGKIRAEIVESKSDATKVGTVAVFDQGFNKELVRFKTGGGTIPRKITHKDVVGTPFCQPVFSLILEQTGGGNPKVVSEGGKTRFEFKPGGGTYTVWANDQAEIIKTERTADRETEVREFMNIKWNGSPNCDF